jgi:uncharacterized membrane protein YraQ (UPF0718 family)
MFEEIFAVAGSALKILGGLWWFILLAIIIGSIMSTLKLDKKVAQFFHRAGVWGIVGALLLGLVSPL